MKIKDSNCQTATTKSVCKTPFAFTACVHDPHSRRVGSALFCPCRFGSCFGCSTSAAMMRLALSALLACSAAGLSRLPARGFSLPGRPRCASSRMSGLLFPDASSPGAPGRLSRNAKVASLLRELVSASPEEQAAALERSTPLLVAPFLADVHEEGAIFSAGMSLAVKEATYRAALADRIAAAPSDAVAAALARMRDHTLEAAVRLRGGSLCGGAGHTSSSENDWDCGSE